MEMKMPAWSGWSPLPIVQSCADSKMASERGVDGSAPWRGPLSSTRYWPT